MNIDNLSSLINNWWNGQPSEQKAIDAELFNAITSGDVNSVAAALSTRQIDLTTKNAQGKNVFDVAIDMLHQSTAAMLNDAKLVQRVPEDSNFRHLRLFDNDRLIQRMLSPAADSPDNHECNNFFRQHRDNVLNRENVFNTLLEHADNKSKILEESSPDEPSLLVKAFMTRSHQGLTGSEDNAFNSPHMPNISVMRTLIEAGAGLGNYATQPYSHERIQYQNHAFLADALIKTNGDIAKAFEIAASSSNFLVARWLLSTGADPIPIFTKYLAEERGSNWQSMIKEKLISKDALANIVDSIFCAEDQSRIDTAISNLTNKQDDNYSFVDFIRLSCLTKFALDGNYLGTKNLSRFEEDVWNAARDIAEMPDISEDTKLTSLKQLREHVRSDASVADHFSSFPLDTKKLMILAKMPIALDQMSDVVKEYAKAGKLDIVESLKNAGAPTAETLVELAINKLFALAYKIIDMGGEVVRAIAILAASIARHEEAGQHDEAQAAKVARDELILMKAARDERQI